jgi:hypothetical protein
MHFPHGLYKYSAWAFTAKAFGDQPFWYYPALESNCGGLPTT